ncbi:Ribosomal RNA small subunit methyltransferase F [termite gut metagenome]|uniref:Ribosomal RNA small subunit methyltransferase F n=1 Tax=termite gut metagenome TaxID=433724 RepID=A0A5J4R4K0_9ZZZZ
MLIFKRMQLPGDFIKQTCLFLGDEDCGKLISALQLPAPVSIRFNPWKGDNLPAFYSPSDTQIPWCLSGYYLKQRPAFTFDPLFHAGCYYVQEASSMFLEQVMKQYVQEPVMMLDLCAAPGGKSTHARSLLPEGSLLVANETMHARSRILAENLTKWGHPGVVITNNDPADFASLTGFFDVILVDAPCSGEGMFRKGAKAINEWSLKHVELCRRRQWRILSDIWSCLKPGGILIYSTCTYNTEENEENVYRTIQTLGAEPLPVHIPEHWKVTGSLTEHTFPAYRFLPYKTEGEGFFLAVLRKPFNIDHTRIAKRNRKQTNMQAFSKSLLSAGMEWLTSSEDCQPLVKGSFMTVFPKVYESTLAILEQTLRIVQVGTVIGEIKGKDLIPQQSLAMSHLFRQDAFPVEDVDNERALAYLRKETISLNNEMAPGYVTIMYKGTPLGFVKNTGSRVNNLYPQEWRIRKQS